MHLHLLENPEWIQLGGFEEFEKSRNEAHDWIKEQECYILDELYKHIGELRRCADN